MSTRFRIVPYRLRPELAEKVAGLEAESYPRFIEEDRVWAEVSPRFYEEFADFQFFVIDAAEDQLVGLCNTVPFNWDGHPDHLPGYHRMLTGALADWRTGKKPNTLSGVQAIIDPVYRGRNVPEEIFAEVSRLMKEHGMSAVVSAIRPTLKDQYPLVPIGEYASWRRDDGQLFDPWLRAQEKMGYELIKSEPESTIIEGSISDWEDWTAMKFPASGDYWLPGGLSTLHIDIDKKIGRHCEPHVWFKLPTG